MKPSEIRYAKTSSISQGKHRKAFLLAGLNRCNLSATNLTWQSRVSSGGLLSSENRLFWDVYPDI
jgi:hypothetical protein